MGDAVGTADRQQCSGHGAQAAQGVGGAPAASSLLPSSSSSLPSPSSSSPASSVGMIAGAVIYSVSGTLLTLVNKAAIRMFPHASLLVLIQNAITVVLLLTGTTWCSATLGDLPRLSPAIVARWTPLSCLFVMMLLSSLLALKHISAVSLVVLRNLTTIVVAVGERAVLGTRFSWPALATLWGMLFGAGIYGSADLAFDVTGYLWLMVNILASSVYQVYVKALAKDDTISPLGMSFISNVVSLPFLTGCSVLLGEVHDRASVLSVAAAIGQPVTLALVLSSGLLGFALSTSAFLLNKLISATSIMVINNANKFAVILLSELFMERSLGPLSSAGTAIVLAFAYLYSKCPKPVAAPAASGAEGAAGKVGGDCSGGEDGGAKGAAPPSPDASDAGGKSGSFTAQHRDALIYVAALGSGALFFYSAWTQRPYE
jgi:Triose-phosphate Transporter family